MKQLSKILILFLAVSLVGCGAKQVVLTPDQEKDRLYFEQKNQHNHALKFFTEVLTKYNDWCESPGYEEVCAVVDPYWTKANTALDTWGEVIEKREPLAGSQEAYRNALKRLKTKMLMKIPDFDW